MSEMITDIVFPNGLDEPSPEEWEETRRVWAETKKSLNQTRKNLGLSYDRCFIATAVYQNPVAEQVELYRWFRDTYLKPNRLGKGFVDWYESGGGQRLADIVEAHPVLRSPSKAALDIGARFIKHAKAYK